MKPDWLTEVTALSCAIVAWICFSAIGGHWSNGFGAVLFPVTLGSVSSFGAIVLGTWIGVARRSIRWTLPIASSVICLAMLYDGAMHHLPVLGHWC